ncbi:hypothetical protein V8E51_001323, partial [Hyaloscypha variabilis]
QNCQVKVRKYILVSQPSRWRKKGDRVVVQSPMLEISKPVLEVPVRRFNGEEQNSVCFIPKQDIERDTSSLYDKENLSKATVWVDAHGVALLDSSVHSQFAYRQGDRFWICIGANTNSYGEIVPVINLRTFEKGDIGISQVCWYPKIRGPNGEVWTLGGGTRQLKCSGVTSYWSWVICQQLDGCLLTKSVEIPGREVELKDTRQLSTDESRSLFQKKIDQGELDESRSCPLEARNRTFVLPTPPTSPDQPLTQVPQIPTATAQAQQPPPPPPLARPWRGIFELSGPTNGHYTLRNSLIHPQELPQSRVNRAQPPPLSTALLSKEEGG